MNFTSTFTLSLITHTEEIKELGKALEEASVGIKSSTKDLNSNFNILVESQINNLKAQVKSLKAEQESLRNIQRVIKIDQSTDFLFSPVTRDVSAIANQLDKDARKSIIAGKRIANNLKQILNAFKIGGVEDSLELGFIPSLQVLGELTNEQKEEFKNKIVGLKGELEVLAQEQSELRDAEFFIDNPFEPQIRANDEAIKILEVDIKKLEELKQKLFSPPDTESGPIKLPPFFIGPDGDLLPFDFKPESQKEIQEQIDKTNGKINEQTSNLGLLEGAFASADGRLVAGAGVRSEFLITTENTAEQLQNEAESLSNAESSLGGLVSQGGTFVGLQGQINQTVGEGETAFEGAGAAAVGFGDTLENVDSTGGKKDEIEENQQNVIFLDEFRENRQEFKLAA